MKRNKREKKNRKKGHRYLFHHTFQALAKISNYLMHMSSLKVRQKCVYKLKNRDRERRKRKKGRERKKKKLEKRKGEAERGGKRNGRKKIA